MKYPIFAHGKTGTTGNIIRAFNALERQGLKSDWHKRVGGVGKRVQYLRKKKQLEEIESCKRAIEILSQRPWFDGLPKAQQAKLRQAGLKNAA